MQGGEIHFIGKRIKEIRLFKARKLTETALKAGISKGLLSRIENGRTIPSLPVLFMIIKAIDENPVTFFEKMGFSPENSFYIHITEREFQLLEKEESTGFNYLNILSRSFNEITFHAVLLNLEPNAKRDPVTTDGMEFIYLVKGSIDYMLGNVKLKLEEGDVLFFDGRIPHLKINQSVNPAKILVIYLLFNN